MAFPEIAKNAFISIENYLHRKSPADVHLFMKPTIPTAPVNPPPNYPEKLSSREVRRRFLSILGDFERPTVPLDLQTTEETLLPGSIVRRKVSYAVAPGERVSALHFFRQGLSDLAPGVLSIHGHGGTQIFPVGKEFHAQPVPSDPSQYSYRLALAGFRVLAPDAMCFGERQATWGYSNLFMDEVLVHAELVSRGKSLLWKSIWDNARAIEVFECLGTRRLGAIGWSGGSIQAYALSAVHPRIEAAVCFASFVTLRHQFYQYRLQHCFYPYVPGMIEAGIDWDQVVALAAPRKCFLGWGGMDEGTPEVMSRAFVESIRHRCEEEHLPDSVVTHEEPEAGHDITESMLTHGIEFLQKSLSETAAD
jgi:dienelactone hydrolase